MTAELIATMPESPVKFMYEARLAQDKLEGEAAAAPAADDGGAEGAERAAKIDRRRGERNVAKNDRDALRRAYPRAAPGTAPPSPPRAAPRVDGRPRRVRVAVQDVHGRGRAEAPLLREDEVPPREDAGRRRRPAMGRRRQERRSPKNAPSTGGATSSATSPLRGEKTRAGDWVTAAAAALKSGTGGMAFRRGVSTKGSFTRSAAARW